MNTCPDHPDKKQWPFIMSEKKQLIIDLIIFQGIWFVCVFGGNSWALLATIINIFLHISWTQTASIKPWLSFIGIGCLIGVIQDSLMIQLGFFSFPTQASPSIMPIWLGCLWLNYWMTWHWSLNWISLRPILFSLIAGIGGGYAYGVGHFFERIEFPFDTLPTLMIVAMSWTLITFSMILIKPAIEKQVHHKFTVALLSLFAFVSLSCFTSVASASNLNEDIANDSECIQANFVGKAYDLQTSELLYTEHHEKKYRKISKRLLKPLTHKVHYLTPDDTPMTTKHLNYQHGNTQPDFKLKDNRIFYIESANRLSPTRLRVAFQKPGEKHIKNRSIEIPDNPVHDAGFHELILKHWETLIQGTPITFDFLAPSRLKYLDFTIQLSQSQNSKNEVFFTLTANNPIYNWAVKPIYLAYQTPKDYKRAKLIRYEGLTNIKRPDTKQYRARIEYHYLPEQTVSCL